MQPASVLSSVMNTRTVVALPLSKDVNGIVAQCSPVNVSRLRASSQLLYELTRRCVENSNESPLWRHNVDELANTKTNFTTTEEEVFTSTAYFLRRRSYSRALKVQSDAAQRPLMGGDINRRLLCVGQVHYLHMARVSPGECQQRVVAVGTQHAQT